MTDGRLDKRHQLRFVAGETPANEGRTYLDTDPDQINRGIGIDVTFFTHRVGVHGCRVLALGEAIAAVVLDDVSHIQIAAHHMRKLTHTDRGRIAIARHADINQFTIGEIGAGRDGGHTPVHAVETVRAAEKVGGGFR